VKRLMRGRMLQLDRVRVQRCARDEGRGAFAAVELISHQWKIDRGERRANLMRAPGFRPGFDHRAMAAIAVGAQRQIDQVFIPVRRTDQDRMIDLADLA